MNQKLKELVLILVIGSGLSLFTSCRPEVPHPKPFGYFKIELPPTHQYRTFDSAGFPFTFRYSQFARITQDSNLVKEENQPYWINIFLPKLGATIYLSYKKITPDYPLERLINESYKLSFSHDVKADYIRDPALETKNGLKGVYYLVGGNAASNYQFYVTDSKANFVRGALYFGVTPNIDSLKPAIDYMKQDLDTLIQSFQFPSK